MSESSNIATTRTNSTVLVVSPNGQRSNQIRSALKTLGFSQISATNSFVEGLARARYRPFTHILFEANGTDMEPVDFVTQVLESDENTILIAVSEHPALDDVFGLLRAGARHFIVVPFNVDTVEEIFLQASDGPPLSDAVLNSPNRNGALAGLILNVLYRVSVLMRQAREFPTAVRELEREMMKFIQTVDMARLFCEGSEEGLLDETVEACIARANVAATRLGRTRKKLQKKRLGVQGEELEGEPEAETAGAIK